MDVPPLRDWSRRDYERELDQLWLQLAQLQEHVGRAVSQGHPSPRMLVIFEGRDAAGKGGAIRRITWNLDPDFAGVWSPSKPTVRERQQWYFQRFVPALPAAGELRLFDRSWYNRAGVEAVMGFAPEAQVADFLQAVVPFERTLVEDGLVLMKFYLDISREEQERRLDKRRADPLKRWKIGPVDEVALEHWGAYSAARDTMLAATDHELAPWTVVRADDKRGARLGIIQHLLSRLDYEGKEERLLRADPEAVLPWSPELAAAGWLAR